MFPLNSISCSHQSLYRCDLFMTWSQQRTRECRQISKRHSNYQIKKKTNDMPKQKKEKTNRKHQNTKHHNEN